MPKSNTKREETIAKRQAKEKAALLEKLQRIPILQIALEQTRVGRSTYYRWRDADAEFKSASDEAIVSGEQLMADVAESKLIGAIKNDNLTAIMFYLKAHRNSYATRIEMTTKQAPPQLVFTEEQKKLIKESVELLNQESPKQETKKVEQPKSAAKSGIGMWRLPGETEWQNSP